MNKRRPASITILGYIFEIKYVDDMPDGQHGEMDADKKVIKINTNSQGEELHATLFHEATHAALFLTGWNERLGEQEEEALVRALEHSLAPLYRLKGTKQ